ncbi:hypothetical protein V6N13_108784 [Hibiscus sabdariffa]
MTKASSGWPSRGHELPPTDWAWPGLGLAERCISHSKGTLPDIGNLVMESLAAPPKRFLALRPTMPGEFDIVRDPKATLHLQYPVAYLSRLQRILPAARWKLRFRAARTTCPTRVLRPRHVPLGAKGPYCGVGNRATGACVASSPDSDLEAFSHNPAHGSFAPLAFQPSAMTNCANQRSKGSIGHAFTVRIRTGNQNQTSFYPFVPHEISVLVELILGHLRYLLTDVPPQPNSPPDNVFRPDRPAEADLGSKKRGCAPLPIHGISPRRSRSQSVPRPARGDPLSPREQLEQCAGSRRVRDWDPPCPSPQSQSFSRGYGSILPTSLAYIVPSTRGCSPWRPDAVMSTTGRGRHSVLRIFKGRWGRTGHHATCGALPAAGTLPPAEPFPGWAGR